MARKVITDPSSILGDLEHTRTTCSDGNPVNYHPSASTDKPRCQRCAVLRAMSDPEYCSRLEVLAFVNYDVTLKA